MINCMLIEKMKAQSVMENLLNQNKKILLIKLQRMYTTLSKAWLTFGVLFFLSSCGSEPSNVAPPKPEVNVVNAGTANVTLYTEAVGQIFGESDVEIQPRVEGWITGIFFKEGSRVEKGSLLYTIDDL